MTDNPSNTQDQKDSQPFRVGDKVTTDFIRGEESVVRTVTRVLRAPYPQCESGWRVVVASTPPCPTCGQPRAQVGLVDSNWFKLAKPRSIVVEIPTTARKPVQ